MRYFLVVFFLGLCHTILARGLQDRPEFYDLERRLVRLEGRQFSEGQNLEHRMLQMEVQLGTQEREEKFVPIQLESNYYTVDTSKANKKPSANDLKLVERLEKIEKNWEKDLEKELEKFSSKYDMLAERFSVIEKKVRASKDKSFGKFKKIGEKYYLIEKNMKLSWFEALAKCDELNANLVSLQNEEEWSAIKEYLESNKSYWVDINDILVEGEYISQSTLLTAPFLKWEAREPNHLTSVNGNEDCVELRRDYNHYMNDIHCSEKNYFICELK